MKISERLGKDTRRKLNNLSKPESKSEDKNQSTKKSKKLSPYELKELMGVNRDRYERRGGSLRRK